MTITTTASAIAYQGNGVTTTFSYAFLIPSQDNLIVSITDSDGNVTVLLTSEYTVTGIDDPDGGIVTYPLTGSPLALLEYITIERELPLTQETDLLNQSGYYPDVVEDALDYITMLVQQVSRDTLRALVAPLNDPEGNLTIPDAATRAGTLLGFDSAGTPIAASSASGAIVSSAMVPVVEAATLAAARTLLGLGATSFLGVGSGLRSDGTDLMANADTVAESTSQSVTAAYNGTQRIATGPLTYTLPRANTLWDGFTFYVFALAGGTITLAPNAADAIGNLSIGTSYVAQPGTFLRVTTDAAAAGVWYVDAHLIGNAMSAGAVMLNGCLVESHAANATTFAVKTLGGLDPSTMDPVYFLFRSSTVGTGAFVVRVVTGALSVTIVSGATMGFGAATAARIWLTAIDNAGTVELAVINCRDGIKTYPLQGWGIVSTTVMNTSSDSAAVMYSTSARSNVPYLTLGYFGYETGIGTPGVWAASPTRIQLFGYGVPLPGIPIQCQENYTGAAATVNTALPTDDTIPLIGEGGQTMTQAITPTSAANLLMIDHVGYYATSLLSDFGLALFQDANANALATGLGTVAAANQPASNSLRWTMLAATTVSTTFQIRVGDTAGHTFTINGENATRRFGGTMASSLRVTEIMA